MSKIVGTGEAIVVLASGSAGLGPGTTNCPSGTFTIDSFDGRTVTAAQSGGFGTSDAGPVWSDGFLQGGVNSAATTIGVSGGVGNINMTNAGGGGSQNWGTGLVLPQSMVACARNETFSFVFTVTTGTAASTLVQMNLYDGLARGGSNAYGFAISGSYPSSLAANYAVQCTFAGFGSFKFGGTVVNASASTFSVQDLAIAALVIGTRYQVDIWLADSFSTGAAFFRVYVAGTTPPPYTAETATGQVLPAINGVSIQLSTQSGAAVGNLAVDSIALSIE